VNLDAHNPNPAIKRVAGNKKRHIPAGLYLFLLFCLDQRDMSLRAGLRREWKKIPVLFVKQDNLFKEPVNSMQILGVGGAVEL